LPTPLSDNTATYIASSFSSVVPGDGDGMIYIAGGCDSPNGNTYRDADGLELDYFMCESVSDKLYGFQPPGNPDSGTGNGDGLGDGMGGDGPGGNPGGGGGGKTGKIVTLTNMPRPRYRHAAVEADNKLWLMGGRTVPEDTIIAEVDVYDPLTDTWSTVGKIPKEYLTSDNGAFTNADKSKIFVVGGYNENYYDPEALSTTFAFDVRNALMSVLMEEDGNNVVDSDLQIQQVASLNQQRGDIHAVSGSSNGKSYVVGGFAGLCQPLKNMEVYDTEKNTWEYVPYDLLSARGDQAMVESNDLIYAIGGEINHPQNCASPELVPPLSESTQPVNDVELFDTGTMTDDTGTTTTNDNKPWIDIVDIPEFRFRFSAASWPVPDGDDDPNNDVELVYVFGGQTSFDDSCKCFPTTNEITTIVKTSAVPTAGNSGGGAGTGDGSGGGGGEGASTTITETGTDDIDENDKKEVVGTVVGDDGDEMDLGPVSAATTSRYTAIPPIIAFVVGVATAAAAMTI